MPTNEEAKNQVCKMIGEVALQLGRPDAGCICGEGVYFGNVPDEVIMIMWQLIDCRAVQRQMQENDDARRFGREPRHLFDLLTEAAASE